MAAQSQRGHSVRHSGVPAARPVSGSSDSPGLRSGRQRQRAGRRRPRSASAAARYQPSGEFQAGVQPAQQGRPPSRRPRRPQVAGASQTRRSASRRCAAANSPARAVGRRHPVSAPFNAAARPNGRVAGTPNSGRQPKPASEAAGANLSRHPEQRAPAAGARSRGRRRRSCGQDGMRIPRRRSTLALLRDMGWYSM